MIIHHFNIKNILTLILLFLITSFDQCDVCDGIIYQFDPQNTIKAIVNPETSNSHSGGGEDQGVIGASYPSSQGDIVTVKKIVMPPSKESYMLDKSLCVLVELKNNNRCNSCWYTIYNLNFSEILDDELCLSNEDIYYSLSGDLSEISNLYAHLYNSTDRCHLNLTNIFKQTYKCYVEPESYFLFRWNKSDVSGNLSKLHEQILTILKDTYGVNWAEISPENITYTYNNSSQCITFTSVEDKTVSILCNKNTSTSELTIYDGRSYPLAYEDNGKSFTFYDSTKIIKPNSSDHITLKPHERLFYLYYIIPKRSGVFYANTLLKSNENTIRPYIDYPLDIEIEQPIPEFDVSLELNTDQIFYNKHLLLKYDITYLSGGHDQCKNICARSERVDTNTTYYSYLPDNNCKYIILNNTSTHTQYIQTIPLIRKHTTEQAYFLIKYPRTGVFSVPGIWINGKHYDFEGTHITVDHPFSRYNVLFFLSLVLTCLGLISKHSKSERPKAKWPRNYSLKCNISLKKEIFGCGRRKLDWIKNLWQQGIRVLIYKSYHRIFPIFKLDQLSNYLVYLGLLAMLWIIILEVACCYGLINSPPFSWWL